MTGKNAKVRYGSGPITMRIFSWDVDDTAGEIDETDGESGGYGETDDTGIRQANLTLRGNLRSADGAPPVAGALLADFLLAFDGNVAGGGTVNKRYLFDAVKVLNFKINGETRGKIEFTMTAKSSGAYFAPGED